MVCRRPLVASLTSAAVLAGGCGASSGDSVSGFSGEARQVAQTVEDVQSAGRKRDAEELCSRYLAKALVQRISTHGRRTCSSTLDESLKDVDAFKLEVLKGGVTVTGTTATAKVKSQSGTGDRVQTLTFVKEPQTSGGTTRQVWKLSSLGG